MDRYYWNIPRLTETLVSCHSCCLPSQNLSFSSYTHIYSLGRKHGYITTGIIYMNYSLCLERATTQYRSGNPTETHSCDKIRAVPSYLRTSSGMPPTGLDDFYQKYTEAYGIPVLGRLTVYKVYIVITCIHTLSLSLSLSLSLCLSLSD